MQPETEKTEDWTENLTTTQRAAKPTLDSQRHPTQPSARSDPEYAYTDCMSTDSVDYLLPTYSDLENFLFDIQTVRLRGW